MENGLVKHEGGRPSIPSEHEMMVFHTMSETAVSSKMYKGIGEKAGVMMIMLAARELGIPPMQSLNGGLNIINGKVEISARMMNALIRKAGHKLITKECTETQCIIEGIRGDTGERQESSFSVAEAQKAGLVKPGGGWTKFPKDMCYARALSRLARQLFSDVIGIGYVEGEISGVVETAPQIQDVTEETEIENEQNSIDKFLELFDREDHYYAMEWLKLVMKNFGWTTCKAIDEMFKDKKRLFDKFKAWKDKFIIAQEAKNEKAIDDARNSTDRM